MDLIAAAHILAPAVYRGRCEAYRIDGQPWMALSYAEKRRYIETASELLKTLSPKPVPVEIVTGLRGKVIGMIGKERTE